MGDRGAQNARRGWDVLRDVYHAKMMSHNTAAFYLSIPEERSNQIRAKQLRDYHEAKIFQAKFDSDQFTYVVRTEFFRDAIKCWKSNGQYPKRVNRKSGRRKPREPHPHGPSWWFLDLVAYHLDRVLDFHVVPHTAPVLLLLDSALSIVNSTPEYFAGMSKADVLTQLSCELLRDDYIDREGSIYIPASQQTMVYLEKDTSYVKWNQVPKCIGEDSCLVTRSSASRMFLLDALLGTVDRPANFFYFNSGKRGDKKMQGVLLDSDLQMKYPGDDKHLARIRGLLHNCSSNVNRHCSCIEGKTLVLLQTRRNLSDMLVASLRKESLYNVSSVYQIYVDYSNWSFIDSIAKVLVDSNLHGNSPDPCGISDEARVPDFLG